MVSATQARVQPNTATARVDLAAAHRLAVLDGLNEGSWNHFSLDNPDQPGGILITPAYTHWSQVTATGLVELGPGLEPTEVDGLTWVAYRIHYPLRRHRPELACVLHAHPPYAVALAMLDEPLNTAEQNAVSFYGRVAFTDDFDASAGSDLGHGEYLAHALGDRATVLFLRNHGVLVAGPTVAQAYTDLYLLERACQSQILAMSTGRPMRSVGQAYLDSLDPQESDLADELAAGHFAAMKRVLEATQPDYRD